MSTIIKVRDREHLEELVQCHFHRLDDVGAARFIYGALHPIDLGIDGLNDFTIA